MDRLASYLRNELPAGQQELADLDNLIREASGTLVRTFRPELAWPHRVGNEGATENSRKRLSHFATVLTSVTLWKLLGLWDRPPWRGKVPEFPPLALEDDEVDRVKAIAEQATNLLIAEIAGGDAAETHSETYGRDDPFTLSYLAELMRVRSLSISAQHKEKLGAFLQARADELSGRVRGGALWDQAGLYGNPKPTSRIISNAMIALRVAQTLRTQISGFEPSADFRDYFETTVHQQLSFFSIPDSRFDPAELAFSLEGLLVSQERHAVDRTLLERGIGVLRDAQVQSAFWRPVKPFLATDKGMSLFPVSVEVANSLIRCCEMFDGTNLRNTLDSEVVPLLRRYFRWTQARTVRFQTDQGGIVGWHSEHVNDLGAIHIWETSLVLEFLLTLRRSLQAHIARQMLIASGLATRDPKPVIERKDQKPDTTEGTPRQDLSAKESVPAGRDQPWPEIVNEPVRALGTHYEIFRRVDTDFIRGWKRGAPEQYSMLLYGPPGTGKTTIASKIADTLGYRLITITVGDFLAAGNAQLEARAKAIFEVLAMQPHGVVLFDEIDSFLLHRGSRRYSKQDTVFQFMTPGMLTKLADLRAAKRVIFIIATNYENRIDPAIKRPGRVDQRYLVLPPDAAARSKIIIDTVKKRAAEKLSEVDESDRISALKTASLFMGYGSIAEAVLDASNRRDESAASGAFYQALLTSLEQRRAATYLGSYVLSPKDKMDAMFPHEELACLLGLATEQGGTIFDHIEKAELDAIVARLAPGAELKDWLHACVPRMPDAVVEKIVSAYAGRRAATGRSRGSATRSRRPASRGRAKQRP